MDGDGGGRNGRRLPLSAFFAFLVLTKARLGLSVSLLRRRSRDCERCDSQGVRGYAAVTTLRSQLLSIVKLYFLLVLHMQDGCE